jgi:opacity protein-like surface antigen
MSVRLALCAVIAACLATVAAAQVAIPMGVYGNASRFDRLTGQRTQSGSTAHRT